MKVKPAVVQPISVTDLPVVSKVYTDKLGPADTFSVLIPCAHGGGPPGFPASLKLTEYCSPVTVGNDSLMVPALNGVHVNAVGAIGGDPAADHVHATVTGRPTASGPSLKASVRYQVGCV